MTEHDRQVHCLAELDMIRIEVKTCPMTIRLFLYWSVCASFTSWLRRRSLHEKDVFRLAQTTCIWISHVRVEG
eukprot:6206918-Pleurochrysis_carterae.AAC.2